MPSRETRAQHKRRQILDGARSVFLAHGFAGAGTDAIAAAAGVSKQTLYTYYPTKEQLLVDAMLELVRRLPVDAVPDEELPRPDDAAALRCALVDLASGFVTTIMRPEYLGLMRVLITEADRHPALAEAFIAAAPRPFMEYVEALRRRGVEGGLLRRVDDDEVHVMMFLGPLLMWAVLDGLLAPGEDAHPPQRLQIEQLVDHWLDAAAAAS